MRMNATFHFYSESISTVTFCKKHHHQQGIHPAYETQGRRHQKSKSGVSVAPQKGLVSSKKI